MFAPVRETTAVVVADVFVKVRKEGKNRSSFEWPVGCIAKMATLIVLLGCPLTLSCSKLGTGWSCFALFRARSR